MAFPDERDRNLIRRAEQVENLATDLCDWLSEFNPARRATDLLPIAESDEFEVLQLRRLAGSLYTSAKVPVAAAAYGASQVGKSLFMGQVLRPHSENYCPIGGDETLAEPAYYKNLSFDNDLNPQCGSQEATALVTRFTTKDRIGASVSPELPGDGPGADAGGVAAGAGPRLPRRVQDARPGPGSRANWRSFSRTSPASHGGAEVDRKWRMDLLDAFSYMRNVDRRGFQAKEAILNGLLSRYPLTEEGYVAAAAALFWDNWESLTEPVRQDRRLPEADHAGRPRPGHLHPLGRRAVPLGQPAVEGLRAAHLAGLAARRLERHLPRAQGKVLRAGLPPRHAALGNEDLETIQAGMLELVHARAAPPPQRRLAEGDRADGLPRRAGHAGRAARASSRASAPRPTRWKSRWRSSSAARSPTSSSATPTSCRSRRCFLLLRGGNLEVKAQMKYHVDKWGRARYGEKIWPHKVRDEIPALFIGMTGLDEEFRNREDLRREDPLRHAAEPVARHAGQRDERFRRQGQALHQRLSHPLPRHLGHRRGAAEQGRPGEVDPRPQGLPRIATWSSSTSASPELRWDAGMKDGDGGQSLIAGGIRAVTSADAKQNQLQKELAEVQNRLLQLSRGWVVDPDTNIDREKRLAGRQEGDRLARRRRGGGLLPRPRPAGIAVRGRRRGVAAFRLRRHAEPAARRPAAPRSCTTSCTNGPPWPCPSAGRRTATRTRRASPGWTPTTSTPSPASSATTCCTETVFDGVGRACCSRW